MKAQLGLCLSLLLAITLAACSKGPSAPDPVDINGVKVDLPKMQAAFANSSQELIVASGPPLMAIRYGKYAESIPDLEKLAANPNLNDAQKKAVTDVLAQMKQVVAKGTPSR
jgi:hypothetical protein